LLKEIPFYDEAVYMNIARNVVEKGLPYRESVPEILWFWHPPLARYISAKKKSSPSWGGNINVNNSLNENKSVLVDVDA